MSLTSDIATLVARYEQLAATFDGKVSAINTALATALATVPAAFRYVYVDSVNGNDANDGLAEAAPVKTLSRAVALVGDGRAGEIRLMSDYVFDVWRVNLGRDQGIYLVGWNARRTLRLPVLPVPETAVQYPSFQQKVAGFHTSYVGLNVLALTNIKIEFPVAPVGGGTLGPNSYSSLLGGATDVSGSMNVLDLQNCEISYPSGGVGSVFGVTARPSSLTVRATTYTASAMAGKWVNGAASGAAPSSLGWLLSNLATL